MKYLIKERGNIQLVKIIVIQIFVALYESLLLLNYFLNYISQHELS